jgi:anti-sigma28 factor (negative regulator of flagellin synthesis)
MSQHSQSSLERAPVSEKNTSAAAPTRALEREVVPPEIAAAREQVLTSGEARLADLRSQYLNGTYRVEAAKVAAKIVDDHLS